MNKFIKWISFFTPRTTTWRCWIHEWVRYWYYQLNVIYSAYNRFWFRENGIHKLQKKVLIMLQLYSGNHLLYKMLLWWWLIWKCCCVDDSSWSSELSLWLICWLAGFFLCYRGLFSGSSTSECQPFWLSQFKGDDFIMVSFWQYSTILPSYTKLPIRICLFFILLFG